ncbi:hypothetical protein JOD54_004274 [Actinokineospora baliensis]|uniref:RICIN domain-containing protein n=1 Tax=Actinokineospora baliensis TaxID=547056 RepID=UPI00195EE2E3|nr:RICIN domain-containing protein [Actinokineospora baliensis]MBM7774070.1 hypothetical protein [Actinokineospora baliensis]
MKKFSRTVASGLGLASVLLAAGMPASASPAGVTVYKSGDLSSVGSGYTKCVDMTSYASGTIVGLNGCSGVSSQQFHWDSLDGRIFVTGSGNTKCLDLGSYAPGTPVGLYPCSSVSSQQWVFGGVNGQQIYSYGSGFSVCIDVASYANGTTVGVFTCSGVTSQRWDLS